MYKPWNLVEIAVVNPAVTVSSGTVCTATTLASAVVVGVLTLFATFMFVWHDSAIQARSNCQRDTVKLLDVGRCIDCEFNAVATFLHTDTSHTSDETVTVDCSTASELLMGSVNRTCSTNEWGPIVGECVRRSCATRPFALPGLPKSALPRLETNECSAHVESTQCSMLLQNSLVIAQARTGSTQVVACPTPGFSGNVTAKCGDDGRWIEIQDNCKRVTCPAEWVSVTAMPRSGAEANTSFHLQLPRLQRVDTRPKPGKLPQSTSPWGVVPCCFKFSNTGSCIDTRGGATFGFVRAICDESGLHVSNVGSDPAGSPGCLSTSAVKSRLDADDVTAKKTYRAFVENTQNSVVAATDGKWALPSTGVMSSVSMHFSSTASNGAGGKVDFTPVVSGARSLDSGMPVLTNQQTSNLSEPLPFTARLQMARGRSAAAFATVACRQFGYRRATVVTNCLALKRLGLEKIPAGDVVWWNSTIISKTDRLFHALCPETDNAGDALDKMCPSSFVVNGADTDYPRLEALEWMRYNAGTHLLSANGSADMLRMDLLAAQLFGNFQVDSPMPPTSSCSGVEEEDDISACFQAQIQERMRGKPRLTHSCMSKLLIGCSDDMAGALGTWVIGDQKRPSLTRPLKIFEQVGGPLSCASGRELKPEEVRRASVVQSNDLCWGSLLQATA